MMTGFFRAAAISPRVTLADPQANANEIIAWFPKLEEMEVELAVFPELSVPGYSCGDLMHWATMLDACYAEAQRIALATAGINCIVVVGMPVKVDDRLYNCAAFMSGGKLISLVPKSYLPNYNEFYEKRIWTPAPTDTVKMVKLPGISGDEAIPLGRGVMVKTSGGVTIGAEICEDLWSPLPPSTLLALNGAKLIVNLSASNELIGKHDYLVSLIKNQSARNLCGYVYASAGFGESSTDLYFDGKAIIAENGVILEQAPRWISDHKIAVADIDIAALEHDRMHSTTFGDVQREVAGAMPIYIVDINAGIRPSTQSGNSRLLRKVNPHPFIPSVNSKLEERCEEVVNIQIGGLARRLKATHSKSLVVGISGGLDSTLALLVAVETFRRSGLDPKRIVGVTMPGFGTTGRTYSNALALMDGLGVSIREINIAAAVKQHFADIGHNPEVRDVTYENSQARERTQILMDLANELNAMVLGTGDLSELALGWATYNGDHMSMYGVNASIPKTLVSFLVRWFAGRKEYANVRPILEDIVDTPISPELIPADANDNITQKTEDLVGPYELHDFILYHTLRFGASPQRIYRLARQAFQHAADTQGNSEGNGATQEYSDETIKHWMKVFYRRFFSQQFKRSCLPDGPKVGSVCLSPRGDWRMPSDAVSDLWLREVENLQE